jgi:hypothetical protein
MVNPQPTIRAYPDFRDTPSCCVVFFKLENGLYLSSNFR